MTNGEVMGDKELRPCPWCGRKAKYFEGSQYSHVYCSGESCNGDGDQEPHEWNGAYCWKELDAKDAEIKSLNEVCDQLALDATQQRETIEKLGRRWVIGLSIAVNAQEKPRKKDAC